MSIDVKKIKADFPIFANTIRDGKPLVYLDSAATSHKPKAVIEAECEFYAREYGTVRRGIYELSARATERYEGARQTIADFIRAKSSAEIIFTRGTTDSINLITRCFGESQMKAGDEIILSRFEHHSNLVPWLMLAQRIGVKLVYADFTPEWNIDTADLEQKITERTKLIAVSGMSNVLGCVTDAETITEIAHARGIPVLIDGAQLVPHFGFDLSKVKCDFLAFSGHKMLGPAGIGVLYMKKQWGEQLPPYLGGGDMIEYVHYDSFTTNDLPWKFEAGTPNMAGAIGLGAAVEYLNRIGWDKLIDHENEITEYALERMLSTDGMTLYGPQTPERRGAVFAFNYKGIHSHDVGSMLDFANIAIRAGHHCAQPLMETLGVNSTARASFFLYNEKEEIDILLEHLKASERFLTDAVG